MRQERPRSTASAPEISNSTLTARARERSCARATQIKYSMLCWPRSSAKYTDCRTSPIGSAPSGSIGEAISEGLHVERDRILAIWLGNDRLHVRLERECKHWVRLRGDRAVPYGDVMGLLNELRGADYLKIALVGLEARSAQ